MERERERKKGGEWLFIEFSRSARNARSRRDRHVQFGL